jgi:hypothetical protein
LPRGPFPFAIAGAVLVVALGFLIHLKLSARFGNDRAAGISLGFFALFSLILALFSSGQLVSDTLSQVGLSWWRFPLVLSGELALGMALSRTFQFLRLRRGGRRDLDVDSAP